MTRFAIILRGGRSRDEARRMLERAPDGYRVEFHEQKRTTPQNAHMWALLTDLSLQLTWHDKKLSPDDWKLIMLAGLNKELRIAVGIDGKSLVPLGQRSSNLSKQEFVGLIELIYSFGAQHGVVFHEDRKSA